jgi:hypothetical protein
LAACHRRILVLVVVAARDEGARNVAFDAHDAVSEKAGASGEQDHVVTFHVCDVDGSD